MAVNIGTLAPATPPQVSNAASSASHSYSVTTTADTDVVAILVGSWNSDMTTNGRATCTWDGGSIAELDFRTQGGSFGSQSYLQAFLVTAPGSPGSHPLVVASPAAGGSVSRDLITCAVPLEGVDMTALPTAFKAENGGTSGTTVSVSVPTAVGRFLLAVGATYDQGQASHLGSVLAQYNFGADAHTFAAWAALAMTADGTPEVLGWTQTSSDDWMIAALEFVPSAGGPPPNTTNFFAFL